MSSRPITIIAMLAALAATGSLRLALAQDSTAPSSGPAAAPAPAADAPTGNARTTRPGQSMYRWVDKDNTVHYSDRPQPGATQVPVQAPQTYTAPKRTPSVSAVPAAQRPASTEPTKPACRITSPTADQVFPNAQSVTISFRGPQGSSAELELNGDKAQSGAADQPFTISPVPRGSYTAAVVVRGGTGTSLCRTPPVTFHVTQPSILNPARPQQNRPRPR